MERAIKEEEEEQKPEIGPVTTTDAPATPSFLTMQPTGVAISHNLQTMTAVSSQMTGNPLQEKTDRGITLQQPMTQWPFVQSQQQQPPPPQQQQQQQPAPQQNVSGQSSTATRRTGGPTQAISFGTLMPMLLPTLPAEQAQKLLALYQKLKRTEISKEDFLRATRLLVGDQVLVNTVKQMQQLQGQLPRPSTTQTDQMQQLPFAAAPHMQHMQQQQQQQQHQQKQQQNQQQQQQQQLQHQQQQQQPQHQQHYQHPQQQQQHHQQQQQQQQHQHPQQQNRDQHPQQHQQQQLPQPQPQQPQQQQQSQPLPQLQQQHQRQTTMLQVQDIGQARPLQQLQLVTDSSTQYHSSSPQVRVQAHPVIASDYGQEHWQDIHQTQAPQIKHETEKTQGGGDTGHVSGTIQNLNNPLNITTTNTTTFAFPSPSVTIAEGSTSFTGITPTSQARTPPKKAEQKKGADVSPMTQARSKKQKVAGDVLEQSIDQLNDVTAVSGVNLREEEEQLLAGPKEESRSSQAMRRYAQEEEGRLFLERGPLHMKVSAIAAKYGVPVVSEEAEQCLSMSVEERLRNMLYKLTKISSRRCDQEKGLHKIVMTSEVQRKILRMRKKAKEAYEKKEAKESERLKKVIEEKEKVSQDATAKDETPAVKPKEKKTKGDDGKQKANAAAARAAAGVNDMLLKWQMMAEQGRQKREGEAGGSTATDAKAAGSTTMKESDKKYGNADSKPPGKIEGGSTSASMKVSDDTMPTRGPLNQTIHGNPNMKHPRMITAKDIIAYLEMEPQMSKSNLLHRLHSKFVSTSQAV